MIIVARKCPFTGKLNTMELPMTNREFDRALAKWDNGALIQHAFPMLTADQREFVKSGITPEKWAELFGDEEE